MPIAQPQGPPAWKTTHADGRHERPSALSLKKAKEADSSFYLY